MKRQADPHISGICARAILTSICTSGIWHLNTWTVNNIWTLLLQMLKQFNTWQYLIRTSVYMTPATGPLWSNVIYTGLGQKQNRTDMKFWLIFPCKNPRIFFFSFDQDCYTQNFVLAFAPEFMFLFSWLCFVVLMQVVDFGLLSVTAYNTQRGWICPSLTKRTLQKWHLCSYSCEGCVVAATLCSLRRIYLFFSV